MIVAALLKRTSLWIATQFTIHEAWAIRQARSLPIMGLFFFATLWIWFIAPMVPLALMSAALMERSVLLGVASRSILILAAFAIAPWALHWYFVCFGMVFGWPGMAQSKEDAIRDRLERLTRR